LSLSSPSCEELFHCIEIKLSPSTSTPKCTKTLERKTIKGRWYTNNLFAFNVFKNDR